MAKPNWISKCYKNAESLERKLNKQFKKLTSFEIVSELEDCLPVFDDSCEEIFNEKECLKLATAGRQKNISVTYVKHNLFQHSNWSRTTDWNTAHIILFKPPRAVQQIGFIGRQVHNTQFLKGSYELATKQLFGRFKIDLDPKTSVVLRYCSIIAPPGPSILYLPSAKAVLTNLTVETERTLYAAANASVKRHKLKKTDEYSF